MLAKEADSKRKEKIKKGNKTGIIAELVVNDECVFLTAETSPVVFLRRPAYDWPKIARNLHPTATLATSPRSTENLNDERQFRRHTNNVEYGTIFY